MGVNPIERVARINAACEGVWGQSGVTAWERQFLRDIANNAYLTAKQENILGEIEEKVFREEEEDE